MMVHNPTLIDFEYNSTNITLLSMKIHFIIYLCENKGNLHISFIIKIKYQLLCENPAKVCSLLLTFCPFSVPMLLLNV